MLEPMPTDEPPPRAEKPAGPSLDEVLRRLRVGMGVTVGSGRYRETYFADGDRLCRRVFDEGETYVQEIGTADLEKAIRNHPEAFGSKGP